MFPVYFKKLYPDARLPEWANGDDTNAAVDLFAYCQKDEQQTIYIPPGESAIIETGIAWYIDTDCLEEFLRASDYDEEFCNSKRLYKMAMLVKSRSGRAFREGLECSNAGVIDEAYTGQIKVKVYNKGDCIIDIEKEERIAQGVIVFLPMVDIKEWDMNKEFPFTPRGSKGFGSSGK